MTVKPAGHLRLAAAVLAAGCARNCAPSWAHSVCLVRLLKALQSVYQHVVSVLCGFGHACIVHCLAHSADIAFYAMQYSTIQYTIRCNAIQSRGLSPCSTSQRGDPAVLLKASSSKQAALPWTAAEWTRASPAGHGQCCYVPRPCKHVVQLAFGW